MNREDIGKLLGGYAANTLTSEEQQALFAAALEDQELFDALAKEQSLRDLLRDPAAKAKVLAALDQPKPGWLARWWRPAALAAASVAAAALILIAVYPKPHPPDLFAIVRERPEAQMAPVPAAEQSVARSEAKTKAPSPRRDRPATAAVKRESTQPTVAVGGGVVGGVPEVDARGSTNAPPLLPPALRVPAAAPPPPPVTRESAPSPAKQVVTTMDDLQVLKAKAAAEFSARDLFRQNISLSSQFAAGNSQSGAALSKDGAVEAQQGQRADAQQQQSIVRQQAVGKGGFANLQTKMLPAAGPVGIRYTVLPQGDSRSIRFEPNAAGRIAVWARPAGGAWRIVQSSSASMLMPITVNLAAGETEAAVWFSRDPNSRAPQEPPPPVGAAANLRLEGPRAGDTATYAASPDPSINEIRFNITLN